MSKDEAKPDPSKVTVDDQKDSAAYQGLGEMNVDTTDDAWEKGVFSDKSDGSHVPAPPRKTAEHQGVDLRKIRKSERPEQEAEDSSEEAEPSLVLPAVIGLGGLVVLGIVGLWAAGVLA